MPTNTRRILVLVFIGVAVAAATMLYFVDPAECVWAPKCMVHELTGWQCPGCGISRATHTLLHGHFSEALRYNYFFIISIPYFIAVCAVTFIPQLNRHKRLYYAVTGKVSAWTYVVLFFLWFVMRNILNL